MLSLRSNFRGRDCDSTEALVSLLTKAGGAEHRLPVMEPPPDLPTPPHARGPRTGGPPPAASTPSANILRRSTCAKPCPLGVVGQASQSFDGESVYFLGAPIVV